MKSTTASHDGDRAQFRALVDKHLKRLRAFVGHEIRYFESIGDLARGEMTVDDVVDAVLLRAYDQWKKAPPQRSLRSWLVHLAVDQVEAEVNRASAERRRTPVHIEEDVPATPPEQEVRSLGDEILDFYEPDEDLRLEDIISDLDTPDPEEEAERRELQRCAREALSEVPREQRRALLLRYADDLTGVQLAKALHRPEHEARRLVEEGRAALRDKLVRAGCTLKTPDV